MFKGNKKYLFIFIGLFILIVGFQYLLPKPINWKRTYMNKDKAPFGCFALFNLMDGAYSQKISVNDQTFYNVKEKLDSTSSVLLVDDKFNFNKSDIKSLFEILNKGNKVFIAAGTFNGHFADTFHIKTESDFFNSYYLPLDSAINKPGGKIRMMAKNLSEKTYTYSQVAWVSSFSNFDTTKFQVLAVTQEQKACLIRAKIGKGELYLMTIPDAFGNYFIVNDNNREMVYSMLSMVKNKEIIWDEYYKTYNIKNASFLKFIFESDALYTAYLLLIFSLVIYMMLEGRRRQRPIPVIAPVTNSTLEFVDVISHVYYNSKNHQCIAIERIKYFYEMLRKKFNVNTNTIDDNFIYQVTQLSGIENKLVKQLFSYCDKIKTSSEISEYDLIELNRQISNFNKNSLR